MSKHAPCPSCGRATETSVLAEARWYPYWEREDGACPACVQEHLLTTLLEQGDGALHREIQARWPLDARSAFGALPTPLRLHADPRFTGRGVAIAILDSGFYPHPDLVRPQNRIRAYVDATRDPPLERFFPISNQILARALDWVGARTADLGVRVVSMSVGGEPVRALAGNAVDRSATALVERGISVVAATIACLLEANPALMAGPAPRGRCLGDRSAAPRSGRVRLQVPARRRALARRSGERRHDGGGNLNSALVVI